MSTDAEIPETALSTEVDNSHSGSDDNSEKGTTGESNKINVQKDAASGNAESANEVSETQGNEKVVQRQGDAIVEDLNADIAPSEASESTLQNFAAAVNDIDDNLDEALGHAADSIWSFATSVTGKVSSVVKDKQPRLESLRKNVTSRLAPLDNFGRDISSQIGALAPTEGSLANITAPMKSVAQTVQRNAQAMEAAILAKANMTEVSEADRGINYSLDVARLSIADGDGTDLMMADASTAMVPIAETEGRGEDSLDVNDEIAKVGEKISNSMVGQTVGGLWSGLWENVVGGADDDEETEHLIEVPKTRFEKKIFELQANPDTYCEPAKDLDAFEQWGKSFVLDDYAGSCIAILDTHNSIAELYERVVPRIVDEDTFWMRFFFAKHVLEVEEERRKKLLERAESAVVQDENEDYGWGDDDWDDKGDAQEDDLRASPSAGREVEASVADIDTPASESVENEDLVAAPTSTDVKTELGSTVENTEAEKEDMNLQDSSQHAAKVKTESTRTLGTRASETKTGLTDDWGDDDWE